MNHGTVLVDYFRKLLSLTASKSIESLCDSLMSFGELRIVYSVLPFYETRIERINALRQLLMPKQRIDNKIRESKANNDHHYCKIWWC